MTAPAGSSATDDADTESLVGHYAGPVTRLLAIVADNFLSVTLYGFLVTFSVFVWNLVTDREVAAPTDASIGWVIGMILWLWLYYGGCLAVWWKTPGKLLTGLRVVNRDGSDLDPRRAVVRAPAYLVSIVLFPLTLFGVVAGKERRAPHDVIAGTAVVYDWNARDARWRLLARARAERRRQQAG